MKHAIIIAAISGALAIGVFAAEISITPTSASVSVTSLNIINMEQDKDSGTWTVAASGSFSNSVVTSNCCSRYINIVIETTVTKAEIATQCSVATEEYDTLTAKQVTDARDALIASKAQVVLAQ